LSQDSRGLDVHRRLSKALTRLVAGFDVRSTDNGDVVWTVVMNLETPVTLSILPLDDAQRSIASSQALALFFKAFREIGQIIGKTDVLELIFHVVSFDNMPNDIKELSKKTFELDKRLADQAVCTGRPNRFGGSAPTIVFIGDQFLTRAVAGEGVGGSMQNLFAFRLLELIYQCFHWQVDESEISPRIVSIVRETLS